MSVALLRDIASAPRPTGSDAIAAARGRVTSELAALGFQVREVPFEFSRFPGAFATPAFGAAAAGLAAIAGHLGAAGARVTPALVSVVGAIVLVLAARWTARQGVTDLPLLRARGVNLEFKRAHARPPGIWLCAHLDTKSQPIPSLARAAGIVVGGIGYVATAALALIAVWGANPARSWWVAAVAVTLAGAVPVVLSVIGANSDGALDNASGVAAVIEAARALEGRDVGVLITDAEELGLAGARAWVRNGEFRGDAVMLNCDGVDDAGDNFAMYAGRSPKALLDRVLRAAAEVQVPCRPRRLPLGILTDSVAFADARLATVTFSRGTFASLARVHTRRDDLAHLRGTGIAEVAALIAGTANQVGWRSATEARD